VVRKLLEMLMHSPALATLVDRGEIDPDASLSGIGSAEISALGNLLDFLSAEEANAAGIIEHFRGRDEEALLEEIRPGLFTLEEARLSEEELAREFMDAWGQYLERMCRARMEKLINAANSSGCTEEGKQEYLLLQKKLNSFQKNETRDGFKV
jgi:hypothetical protein